MPTYVEKMLANFLWDNWSQFVLIFVYMCVPQEYNPRMNHNNIVLCSVVITRISNY